MPMKPAHLLLLGALSVTAVGCSGDSDETPDPSDSPTPSTTPHTPTPGTPTPTPTPTATATPATPTATPTTVPTPTPTATPTPATAILVTVDDQIIENYTEVMVASATSDGPGFIVIHEDDGTGTFGNVIGHTALVDGANTDIMVTLDRAIVDGETLYAMLHFDAGDIGTYEFPGADAPVTQNGAPVAPTFVVSAPSVQVSDQEASPANMVVIDEIMAAGNSFIVIHESNDAGSFGAVLGNTAVAYGSNTDVAVALDRNVVNGEVLWAMLHDDTGVIGQYEFPDADAPLTYPDGSVITPTFVVTASETIDPQVTAMDQIIEIYDQVMVPSATSDGPGFLVIHEDNGDGGFGAVIGHAPLEDGGNTSIMITLDRHIVDGETLYAMLHSDTGEIGVYEFPTDGNDAPVADGDGNVITPTFIVNQPSVAVSDQSASPANRVIIDEVVAAGDSFLVIHEDNGEGSFGAVIGNAGVGYGVNTDVEVSLDRDVEEGETLWAMLHDDTGVIGTYEFPTDGNDPPMADIDGNVITPTFVVSVGPTTQARVVAVDQIIEDFGMVMIAQVSAAQDGFIVIHEESEGSFGGVIGHASVSEGDNTDVMVSLDRDTVNGETLYAMLHIDDNMIGTYEFPTDGNDAPATDNQGNLITPPFRVDHISVNVRDQVATPPNRVIIEEIYTAAPSFIVIHEDNEGTFGAVLGQTSLEDGRHQGVNVTLNRDVVEGETLYAMLHTDLGVVGTYEFPGMDTPLTDVDGNVITPTFTASVGSSEAKVTVRDQVAGVYDQVTIEEVVAETAGFLVIHEAGNEGFAAVIGNAPVSAGFNGNVVVTLDRDVEDGETLYAMLHIDDNMIGTYEFPTDGYDAPATDNDGNLITPAFTVMVPGVTVRDQTASPSFRVVIEEVVSYGEGFLVIHEDNEGTFGNVLGWASLRDGAQSDVTVLLNRSVESGETLWAMLHTDVNEIGNYEFPGPDAPVVDADGNVITPTFSVTAGSDDSRVTVMDQVISNYNQVTIQDVVFDQPAFIVIHEDNEGSFGAVIGHATVNPGITEKVVVTLDRNAMDGELLYAMLHSDNGEIGVYEFPTDGLDAPVANDDGDVITPTFTVQHPKVEVQDQVAIDDLIQIDLVRFSGPGFIVIHEDNEGSFGNVIGHTAIAAGDNLSVNVKLDRVPVDQEILWAMLHTDSNIIGAYEFPGPDGPVVDMAGSVITPTFVVTADN